MLGATAVAHASVVTYMDTETLVRLSPVIVRGEVESIVSRSDAAYTQFHTDVTVRVHEWLKGAAGRDRVTVRLIGGSVDGHQSFAHGSPGFRKGERVLLFLQRTKGGALTVAGLYQGKFRIETEGGREVGIQEGSGDTGVVLRRGQGRERPRRALTELLEQVRQLAPRYPAPPAAPGAAEGTAEVGPAADLGFTLRPLIPLRWFEPDSGLPVTMMFNPTGAPAVVPGGARPQFAASGAAWTNVLGSTIVMADGGDTAANCWRRDNVNAVSHGDPCNQFPDFDPVTCSGVLAVTAVANLGIETRTVNGQTFLRFKEQDIVINGGTDCFFSDPGNYGEVVVHEIGHVTGLGHSCGDAFTPACVPGTISDDATMRALAHGDGRGATPHAGDINGLRFMYPPPGFIDAKLNGSAFSTGQAMSLTADLNGTDRADLYVILGLPGGSFIALGASAPNTLAPLASNLQLGFAVDAPLFNLTFAGSEPAGSYYWVTLLVRPGTSPLTSANWLSSDVLSFTFTP
jgi:hypothetical protein